MGRPVRKIQGYTPDQIKALFGQAENDRSRIRLYAVYQVSKGKPCHEVGGFYNTSPSQVLRWVGRFEQEGLEGLKDKKGRGRKSRLGGQQKARLQTLLLEESPVAHGYNTDTWTGPLAREWILKAWDIEYRKVQIYNIIKSLGLTYQKSRGFYPEADKEGQEAFKDSLKKTPGKPSRQGIVV